MAPSVVDTVVAVVVVVVASSYSHTHQHLVMVDHHLNQMNASLHAPSTIEKLTNSDCGGMMIQCCCRRHRLHVVLPQPIEMIRTLLCTLISFYFPDTYQVTISSWLSLLLLLETVLDSLGGLSSLLPLSNLSSQVLSLVVQVYYNNDVVSSL